MPPGGHITSDSDLESVISLQVGRVKPRRNSGGEKYFCSVEGCKQSFTRLDHLDRHEYKQHTGIKKHACHYEGCTKTYSILTHLKRHIRTTHERPHQGPNKTIPCEVDTCDKMFTSLTNMNRHIREVHENPKVYKCQYCDEKFSQKLKMRRHEISKHTGVYPHTCDKCSKGFYQKWQWEKHEETCKIYPCLTCNKKFEKWTLFIKHCKENQHGRKYYKCEYCESAYVKPSDLQKHVAAKHISEAGTKTGEYKCTHEGCDRSYAYERNLRQHILIAHEGRTFDCTHEDCDKVFSSSQNLQKHIQRDHSAEAVVDVSDNDEASTSFAKKNKKETQSAKRKKRKDAGISKVSNLAKLSGIVVDKDLNKRLKSRESEALETVAEKLSEEMQLNDSHSELDVSEGQKDHSSESADNIKKDQLPAAKLTKGKTLVSPVKKNKPINRKEASSNSSKLDDIIEDTDLNYTKDSKDAEEYLPQEMEVEDSHSPLEVNELEFNKKQSTNEKDGVVQEDVHDKEIVGEEDVQFESLIEEALMEVLS